MGLDMYLKRVRKIRNATLDQILKIEGYLSYIEKPENKKYTLEEWCGLKESDINALDPKLIEDYKEEYIKRYSSWDVEKNYGYKTLMEMIADWRKANHIHKWFVDNVQNGVDDCGYYEVTKENLETLLTICKKVLLASELVKGEIKNGERINDGRWEPIYEEGEYIKDPAVAKDLLPTESGFFFGGTEYDQWYIADIKYTVDVIEKVLNETNFNYEMILYRSSW